MFWAPETSEDVTGPNCGSPWRILVKGMDDALLNHKLDTMGVEAPVDLLWPH